MALSNLKYKNQEILLMTTDDKKWHYLAIKKLSTLLRRITSKHDGDPYCLNCFHSYSRKCEDHDYYVEMSKKDNKTLKYNHGEKSMKVQFIIYADLECSFEKGNTWHNNPKK